MGQKSCVNKAQVAAAKHEYVTLSRVFYPTYCFVTGLLILGRFHPCYIFCPIAIDILSMIEVELALM
mgnify:CR=1 FL=1